MFVDHVQNDDLTRAVEVAIAGGQLPQAARVWGKTVLLEELASAIGLARNTLRNLYYRGDPRLQSVLHSYVASSWDDVARGLQNLQFRAYEPIVWKRPPAQLQESRRSLTAAVALARSAAKALREMADPPVELRRDVGTVAAEIMACALTFFDGDQRWQLLREGEQLFLAAMAPVAFQRDIEVCDAELFAKFWENRATRCGLEWSNIWDDPSEPPTISMDVVRLAVDELDHAAVWTRRHGGKARRRDDNERLRQLLADKAKWLAKAGRFSQAERELAKLGAFQSVAAQADALLVRALGQIAGNHLEVAARVARQLAELVADGTEDGALAPVTAAMMVHNIELLRGRRPRLPDTIQHFLEVNPVAASEMINLPRYKERLAALGYKRPTEPA